MRVLLLEDQHEALISVKWAFDANGVVVDMASNRVEAVELMRERYKEYGMVLMSGVLGFSSPDATRDEIKHLATTMGRSEIPIVAMGNDPASVDGGKGFTEVVRRPVQKPQVDHLVEKYNLGQVRQGEGNTCREYKRQNLWKKKVLYIDDDDTMDGIIPTILQEEFMDVHADGFRNVMEVLETNRNFLCCVMNLSGNSLSYLAEIKSLHAHIPVIGVCLQPGECPSRDECMVSGLDHYISPPVERVHLLEVIYLSIFQNTEEPSPSSSLQIKFPKPPLQLSELMSMFEGDWECAMELLEVFLDEGKGKMEELVASFRAWDIKQLKFSSHTLKGSSRSCCLADVGEIYAKIDLLGKNVMAEDDDCSDEATVQHVKQHLSLLISLAQRMFIDIQKYEEELQLTKVLDMESCLEAADNDYDSAMAELLDILHQASAMLDTADIPGLCGLLSIPIVESAAPNLHAAAEELAEEGEEALVALESELENLHDDLLLLLGEKAL